MSQIRVQKIHRIFEEEEEFSRSSGKLTGDKCFG